MILNVQRKLNTDIVDRQFLLSSLQDIAGVKDGLDGFTDDHSGCMFCADLLGNIELLCPVSYLVEHDG